MYYYSNNILYDSIYFVAFSSQFIVYIAVFILFSSQNNQVHKQNDPAYCHMRNRILAKLFFGIYPESWSIILSWELVAMKAQNEYLF